VLVGRDLKLIEPCLQALTSNWWIFPLSSTDATPYLDSIHIQVPKFYGGPEFPCNVLRFPKISGHPTG